MIRKYTTEPLQEFTSNGTRLFVLILPLYVVLLNFILFGTNFFSSIPIFLSGLFITFVSLSVLWLIHTWVGLALKEWLPDEKYYFKQLAIKLCLFIVFKSLVLFLLFSTFVKLGFIDGDAEQQRLIWLLLVGNVFNISVTLLHEGSRGLDRWKATLVETEQLRKTYLLSQLMNLKSQVSPQFLFTNLDVLSGLMYQDPNEAEAYLDELSKVYQYFLKTSDESLVTMQCEVSFLHSYYYLIRAQKQNIKLSIEVNYEEGNTLLPPFTLQALFDHAIKRGEMNADCEVHCMLFLNSDAVMQFKIMLTNSSSSDQASQLLLDNVIRKFSLLTQQAVAVEEGENYQLILLPLILKNKCVAI